MAGAGPTVAALPPPGLAVPGLGRPPGVLPDMSKPPPGFMGAAVSVTPFDHLSYLKPFEIYIYSTIQLLRFLRKGCPRPPRWVWFRTTTRAR